MASLWMTFLLCLLCTNDVTAQAQWGKYDRMTDNTLYKGDANIIELFDTNVTLTVTGSTFAWAVQFYASWCGHCQRFQPVWTELARDIKDKSCCIKCCES